jgi:hypothetical protein
VVVGGSVIGDVLAVEQIALGRTSRLVGNLSTARISMEDGAYFAGKVEMRKSGGSRATAESIALEKRYSKLIADKYARGLTAAEEGDLESVYAGLIAHDAAFYELRLVKAV